MLLLISRINSNLLDRHRPMVGAAFDDLVQDRIPMVPSIEPKEVFIYIFLQILFVAVRMHSPEPVFKVPDLDMRHFKVLPFIGQRLF